MREVVLRCFCGAALAQSVESNHHAVTLYHGDNGEAARTFTLKAIAADSMLYARWVDEVHEYEGITATRPILRVRE